MNRTLIALLVTAGLSNLALAGVKVTSLDLKTKGSNGYLLVGLEGRSNELPDIKVNGKNIEITLSQAEAFQALSKNVQGSQLAANSLNGSAVIKVSLPYEVKSEAVNLNWKNKDIEVTFPRGKVPKPTPSIADQIVTSTEKKIENDLAKEALNEDYLNKLMKENAVAEAEKTAPPAEAIKNDVVAVKQAALVKDVAVEAPKKSSTDSFSFAGYAAKFTVFLALVLGMFYGVVQLLKKGVFNRGKLGFLNNAQMIEVLSTTYVAPKRSLMMVRAHKQVFLVANSESGLSLLSEMKDTSGLLKEGEKFVTGTNFDSNINQANEAEFDAEIKLKEDILESTPVTEEKGISKLAVARDIVKFSDELKKKAKKLKPIEFN